MTDQATRVVPAGWYQDPALSEQVRWWNGIAWTEHVREKPTAAAAPTSSSAANTVTEAAAANSTVSAGWTATVAQVDTTADRIAAARELERQFGIGTSENEIIADATALGYGAGVASRSTEAETPRATRTPTTLVNPAAQQAAASGRRRAGVHAPARTSTGSAWLIALIPLLTLVAGIAAAYIYFYVAQTPIVFIVALVLPYLLGILWALSDGRALTSRGFAAPSPAWALLGGLGYLIVRRIRVPGSGPLAMLLIVGALVIAIPTAAYATGQLRPLQTALTIQNTITKDYLRSGRAVSVNCPPFVDATTSGTLYTCQATLSTGVTKAVWVSIDGAEGQFSYAMAI